MDPKFVPAKVAMARLLMSSGEIDAAEREVDSALVLAPRDGQALDVKGLILGSRGNQADALIRFNDALKDNPANIQVLLDRANIYLQRGDIDAAEKDVKAAEALNPNTITGNYLDALINVRHGKLQDADVTLNRIRAVMDRMPDAYLLAGVVKYNLGQMEQAENLLTRYIAKRKDRPLAYQVLGALAVRQGNSDRAIAMLEQARTLAPNDPDTVGLLGQAYVAKGDNARALSLLTEAVKSQPDNTKLRTGLAVSRLNAGDTGAGLDELSNVFKSGADIALAGPPLVLGALRSQRIDQAAATAEALVKQAPDNLFYQQLLGAVRVAQKDMPGAEKIFRGILDKQPNQGALRRSLAQVYLAMNRPQDAKKLFQDQIAKNANDTDSMQGLADLLANDKDYDSAIKQLARAASNAPADPAPRLRMVALYELQKKWPDAIKEARALQLAFSGSIEARDALGRVYLESGDVTNSVAAYRDAVRAFPNSAPLQANYATSLMAAKDFIGATAALSKAIALEPRDYRYKNALVSVTYDNKGADAALAVAKSFSKDGSISDVLTAGVLDKSGKRGAAISLLEKLQSATPSKALALQIAELHRSNNDVKGATAGLEAWVKDHPNDSDVMQRLAELYAVNKDYDNAMRWIARAATAAPADPTPRLRMVTLYQIQKRWPEAIKEARALQIAFSGNIEVRDTLGRVYLGSGDLANSVATYRDAVKAFPNSALLQSNYGTSLAQAKDYPGAIAALSKATALDPRDDRLKNALVSVTYDAKGPEAALAMARSFSKDGLIGDALTAGVLEKSGKRGEAIALLEKQLAANPSMPVAFQLAELYERNNDMRRALAGLEAWAKNHPADSEPRMILAQAYGRARNYSQAQAVFEKLAIERPNDMVVLNNLAWLYGRTNDPRARKMAEKAFQLAPDVPAVSDTLGWIMTNQGDVSNAMKYLQTALDGLPGNPDVQYHFALALSKSNKVGDARAMLQKALAAKDDFESKADAKQLLDRLAAGGASPGVKK